MADVRALLAAERQSRRISHPHLSYTKSGMLICNRCNLNIKSEALWEGHLKSANHRRNAQALQEPPGKGLKRKIEDVDEVQEERDDAALEARKKPKSRPESITADEAEDVVQTGPGSPHEDAEEQPNLERQEDQVASSILTEHGAANPPSNGAPPDGAVDEDEWAAFEREVAPLAASQPDYTSATISAAPVTAAQLSEQADEEKHQRIAREADDEKEEEERRLEEEFEVMEEMEERLRKLREKREALKNPVQGIDAPTTPSATATERTLPGEVAQLKGQTPDKIEDDDEDDEDDDDDWYG